MEVTGKSKTGDAGRKALIAVRTREHLNWLPSSRSCGAAG
jgi:hypothetical protein